MRLASGAVLFAALLALGPVGCQSWKPRKAPAKASRAHRAPPARVDLDGQRRAYERGVAHFGEDKFAEAREAWLEAVRRGPETELGRKARENLAKVENILKSLRELNAQ